MYKDNRQLRIGDFMFPYGKLDPENDWVKLAALVLWEVAEERYAARFANNGLPDHPARMALGALLIQRRLKCSDQWLVKHMGENPYLQYFIGMKEYGPCPFGASSLVAFRKRFSEQDLAAILEASVPKEETEKQDDSDDGNNPPNSGTLILDATCCPAASPTPKTLICSTVYEQQRLMFESGTHSIPRRIVSLAQPWVRPIVRGKAHANTEFGAKLHIRLVDGYARIERLDFEPFNESEGLWRAVARYRERYGCYPKRILADKLYRSRQALAFCKEHGIRLSGTAKTAYGLARVMARLRESAICVIGIALLLSNLSRSLRAAPALFGFMFLVIVLPRLRSRAYLRIQPYFSHIIGP